MYAEDYFILVVLAVEIWATGQAFSGFLSSKINLAVTVVSSTLGLVGFILWCVNDEKAMFAAEYLIQAGKQYLVGLSFLKVVQVLCSALFNYFFSKVITAALISKLSAMTFAHGTSGNIVYEEMQPDGTVLRQVSTLRALNIWNFRDEGAVHVDGGEGGGGNGVALEMVNPAYGKVKGGSEKKDEELLLHVVKK